MTPPPPSDPLRAWQEAVARLLTPPGLAGQPPELVQQFLAPFVRQAELLQEAFEQQSRLQRDFTRQAFEPVEELVGLVEQAAASMRQGTEAFGHASSALSRIAQMLDGQATVVERTAATARRRLDLLAPPPEPGPDAPPGGAGGPS